MDACRTARPVTTTTASASPQLITAKHERRTTPDQFGCHDPPIISITHGDGGVLVLLENFPRPTTKFGLI